MFRRSLTASLLWLFVGSSLPAAERPPLEPFQPDEHTLLLYHFDEGQGPLAKDSSGRGYDGQVRGAHWCPGKFHGALEFDGKDDTVYRAVTEAIHHLKAITVECWFKQDNPEGRQFLLGKDMTLHFDLSGGSATSISLYNRGASVANADGLRHQHVGAGIGPSRHGRWHHLAATYDGHRASFFLDGLLRARVSAPKDFWLGLGNQGLWIGSYVGRDYWFSGKIDEVRVSDCVRYDPQQKLAVGARVFDLPGPTAVPRTVRKPTTTGKARLSATFKKSFGGNAAGWVYLKPRAAKAVIVGKFDLKGLQEGQERTLEFDVSDEFQGDGLYILGLENTAEGYYRVTSASLRTGDATVARWSGNAASRRTFQPPVLVPLRAGQTPPAAAASLVLLPDVADRLAGTLELISDVPETPSLFGEGLIEYWLDIPSQQTYRVWLRYAAPGRQPCDIVIDGNDLNDYNMCALNRTDSADVRDAFWEYQGTVVLAPGLHWLRLQDVLPQIVAVRLEPVAASSPVATPWERYPVPDGSWLGRAAAWKGQPLFGQTQQASVALAKSQGRPVLRYAASFANTDKSRLFAGDAVRLVHAGQWDLEPFGRLRFRFEGQGSGHVVSLRAVDVRGTEKLLWRRRDKTTGVEEVVVPISFEGNDVFDPSHVVAICLELDEGTVQADQVNRCAGGIADPVFDRRDVLALPDGYPQSLAAAKEALARQIGQAGQQVEPLRAVRFQPWTRPVVPEAHPLFAATEPKPVMRKTLGAALHMTGARSIDPRTLDTFHKHYQFGDVCWPHISMCPQRRFLPKEEDYRRALHAFEERLVEVRGRGLYLFDVHGYVPYHEQFPHRIAPEHREILLRVFGDRFLGFDNGEQDGRYIGAYADKGPARNRKDAWGDFVKWDEHVCGDNGNYMNATGSLNFSHYYGERNCRLLGLETAQGLPSDTLMFAFLRGAGKQYGRLIYQASSIWNRFGYNMYHARKTASHGSDTGYGFGPNKGCSRSLHKRLFFCGYLDGHSIFGTETSQFTADEVSEGVRELSPLGRQHLELRQWVDKHPDRGVLVTPVAFMLDFHNGWNMPRHLYRGDKYKIWGKFPYEKGDYLIDNVFRLVWPGYEAASYLRNERGFITATPFGDIFDVITNRCHPEVLKQYSAVMLLGDVEMTPEVTGRLVAYVRAGGDLVIDSRAAKALPADLTGVRLAAQAKGCMSHLLAGGQSFEEQPYGYTILGRQSARPLLVNEHGHPLVTVNRAGKGRVVVGAVDHWMTDALAYRIPEIVNMELPYQLLRGVRAVLSRYFDSFNPVEIEPAGLNIHTCCYHGDPQRLLVGLLNNDLFADWRGGLRVRIGAIASARELWRGKELPAQDRLELVIPAGDVAIVEIRLK
jgi:hypothetical protein